MLRKAATEEKMSKSFHIGDPPIEVQLHRSARAKRYSLRVSSLDGSVRLTMPQYGREKAALDFVREKSDWLQSAMARQPQPHVVGYQSELPVEGQLYTIRPARIRTPRLEGGDLLIGGNEATLGKRLAGFLKARARERLAHASRHYAEKLGRDFAKITLRDTRSRWGSCTHDGNLMYSWRLILAPPEVLDYVAAHEVAHLIEMNHSPAFWANVAAIMPGYKTQRSWLRTHGSSLHRYQFDRP